MDEGSLRQERDTVTELLAELRFAKNPQELLPPKQPTGAKKPPAVPPAPWQLWAAEITRNQQKQMELLQSCLARIDELVKKESRHESSHDALASTACTAFTAGSGPSQPDSQPKTSKAPSEAETERATEEGVLPLISGAKIASMAPMCSRKSMVKTSMTNRLLIWRCFEDSSYSTMARVYAIVMMLLILISTISAWLETVTQNAPPEMKRKTPVLSLVLQFVFLFELLARFGVCPNRNRFFYNILNVLDLVIACGMIPVLIFIVSGVPVTGRAQTAIFGMRIFFPTLVMLKLLRRFKTFTLLILACRRSVEALPVLLYTLFVICLAFTAIFYILEAPDNMADIKDCFWYVIVTVATIGYGDIYPKTNLGRIAGGCLITVGVLYMAIPIGIIGTAFSNVWEDRDQILAVSALRDQISWAGLTSKGVRELFEDIDEDGSGALNFQEFSSFIAMANISLSTKIELQIFQSLDTNCGDTICIDEFVKALYHG